jgi:chromosomal replication initiator protein
MASRIGNDRFKIWFGTQPEVAWDEDSLTIRVANPFARDWLQTRFQDDAVAASVATFGSAKEIIFEWMQSPGKDSHSLSPTETPACVDVKPAREAAQSRRAENGPSQRTGSRLDESLSRLANFASYQAGENNQLALAAARAVCQSPGEVTPLVLCGSPGVGKTHLLEAIWSDSKRLRPQAVAVYHSAEQFTCSFVEALKAGGLPGFRRKYRQVDLLMIDDIQFLDGKQATQGELLHTAEALSRLRRQVVFTADRPPAELCGLVQELISRMTAGIVCDVLPPDETARRQIVRRFAEKHALLLPDEVVAYVAASFSRDARALCGAVHRLRLASVAYQRPITLSLAKETLEDLLDQPGRPVTLELVERVVCDVCGIRKGTLQTEGRSKNNSHPRMLAMWLARKHTRAALSEIGDYFGRRSHSAVVAANKKVEGWLSEEGPRDLFQGSVKLQDLIRKAEEQIRLGRAG